MSEYDLRCVDAGASCRGHIRADNEDEFRAKLADHLKKKHKVEVPNETVIDYLAAVAQGERRPVSG